MPGIIGRGGGRIRGIDVKKQRLHSRRTERGDRDKRPALLDHNPDKLVLPSLTGETLTTPTWMNAQQREVFEDIRNHILMLDIAAISDKFSLEMLCTQYTQYVEICEIIFLEGYLVTVTSAKGETRTVIHPLIVEKNRLQGSIKALLTEFGMTPNSRRTVFKRDPEKADSKEEEGWDELLN